MEFLKKYVQTTHLNPSNKTVFLFDLPQLAILGKAGYDLMRGESGLEEFAALGLLVLARLAIVTFDYYYQRRTNK